MSDFWSKLTDGFVPEIIKSILNASGYDNILSLTDINEEEINVIEQFAYQNLKHLIEPQFDSNPFKFLPGHRKLILALGKKAEKYEPPNTRPNNSEYSLEHATTVMKELIKSMQENANVTSTRRRYSEIIKHLASYIYIVGGKAAYEVLCNNLPLPQVPTVCKLLEPSIKFNRKYI